jgi:hypothetical protein
MIPFPAVVVCFCTPLARLTLFLAAVTLFKTWATSAVTVLAPSVEVLCPSSVAFTISISLLHRHRLVLPLLFCHDLPHAFAAGIRAAKRVIAGERWATESEYGSTANKV